MRHLLWRVVPLHWRFCGRSSVALLLRKRWLMSHLPWRDNQFFVAENYWEAAGVLSALRAGIAPNSIRRPFPKLEVKTWRDADPLNATIPRRRQ